MVYVKRVELSRFKSFGGSNSIPFLPGFTVISGPNGSGKSNILDALLFCLGLASSKGMRADRLPDLINNTNNSNKGKLETIVSVTFDISDWQNDLENIDNEQDKLNLQSLTELKITRRLRVTKNGSYASTFYVNEQPCTATELQSELNRLRIYPEGYNVVLQGDVTRIITMNSKERREIIDELAGVAEFDRKINQTRVTLDAVKEREEKCHIIAQELFLYGEKLKQDSEKALKYQKLKNKIQEKQQCSIVINWRYLQAQEKQVNEQLIYLDNEQQQCQNKLNITQENITSALHRLEKLNQEVKALGEEEQITIASHLATQKAKRQQLTKTNQDLAKLISDKQSNYQQIEKEEKNYQQQLTVIEEEKLILNKETIPPLSLENQTLRSHINELKETSQAIASQSQAWLNQQTILNQEIKQIQEQLNPKITQEALLKERCQQLEKTITNDNQILAHLDNEINAKLLQQPNFEQEVGALELEIQSLAQKISAFETENNLSQETIQRLNVEQRDKQRQLDKIEATKQAQQEVQGSLATKLILNSDLPGVCGLVAQLGQVETAYQLALEIAGGGRLGFIVVEDDSIASAGIKLLKQEKAGRATFLPLNKIKSPRIYNPSQGIIEAVGYIDLALNLISCDEKYDDIFGYVFGSTVVFRDLNSARPFLGQERIVTLDGELLEVSGALTGGSINRRNSLRFGKVGVTDSHEVDLLYQRIQEIETIISQFNFKIAQNTQKIKQSTNDLDQARQNRQKKQYYLEQWQKEINRLQEEKEKIIIATGHNYQSLVSSQQDLANLQQSIPFLQAELIERQEALEILESSYDNQQWHDLQTEIQEQEKVLEKNQNLLIDAEKHLEKSTNQIINFQDKLAQIQTNKDKLQREDIELNQQFTSNLEKIDNISEEIVKYEQKFQQLAEKLTEVKQQRDQEEKEVKRLENEQQKLVWHIEKLILQHQENQTKLSQIQTEIQEIIPELPQPIPEIPYLVNDSEEITADNSKIIFDNLQEQLEQIKKEINSARKRLEALEPVNMLALEEYEKNQERLTELSEKLATLQGERTELLLRVENFTTLRLRAFSEAFIAVNENFKTIFATLSEGDGYLKLEDENNPFNGGLTLVAHPKGKPVTRLSSMSGGEKSLTALSFIFALQRYRPSPFYAFDEVDMFLDGANVEKLSKMIQTQAKLAQFIVVSLRRPMIEASQRTIGVTQARGAYTQVLGIKL
ncbi:MAG: chromosome segregation protein SMC [Cyanobacterium sp. T60_A2020_053]|nr:chromosome segregation protein SMC [Cyanobacterium sp. T60_A2020_053]